MNKVLVVLQKEDLNNVRSKAYIKIIEPIKDNYY